MKRILIASIAAASLALGFVGQADAAARVQIGRLACDVQGGIGLIFTSSKNMTCRFQRDGYGTEWYRGNIKKFGIDIGETRRTHIEWLVFAATRSSYTPHALAGQYVGGSGEATIGVGVGANWLVGGFHRSFALQPLSVQAQTGINVSLAFAELTLR
jgi:hypothetical protein